MKSAKVSINTDYSTRGYGFVHFANEDLAKQAIQAGEELGLDVVAYAPKDRRELRKLYNNIYVKNFPEHWGEKELRDVFSKYGNIISLAIMKKKRE